MTKRFFVKLMGWGKVRESNWTKANMELSTEKRNSIMNKAHQDLKDEQRKIFEQVKRRESEEKSEEELPHAA